MATCPFLLWFLALLPSTIMPLPLPHGNASADWTLALLVFAACSAIAWLLPNHYYPWSSFHQEAMAALGGGVLAVGVLLLRGGVRIRWPRLALLALATAAVPLLQHAAGLVLFRSDALMSALYIVGFGLAIAVGATMSVGGKRSALLDALFGAMLVAGVASTGLALCQWLGVTGLGVYIADLPFGGRPYANVGQPNHLATLLAWSVLALLRWYEQRRIGAVGLAVGSGWLLVGVALAQSRTSFVVALLLVVWCAFARCGAPLRTRWPALAVGTLVLLGLMLAVEPVSRTLMLEGGSLEGRLEAGTRWIHWRTLFAAVQQSPLTGYGWNQVVVAQQAVALEHPASHNLTEHGHNLVLDLLLWNGVPLGAALSVALVAWLWKAVRRCESVEHWIVVAAVLTVSAHALVEYPLDYAYMLFPVGVLIGCAGRTDTAVKGVSRWTLAIPLAVVAGMGVAVGWEYAQAERAVREARFALAGYARTDELADLEINLLDGLREYHRYMRTQARPQMSPEELEWMRRVALRYPYPPSLLRAATAFALNGHAKEAGDALALLCKVHPQRRCDEGRDAWSALMQQYPQLGTVTTPFAR